MNWQQFLGAGASFDRQGRAVLDAASFPPAYQDTTVAMPLSHYACLSVTGPDTHKFLQGQLSCDMQMLTPEQSLSGALCTPKGRMVSNFYLQHRADDQVFLLLPHGTVQATQATLAKYVVFSKAEMQAETHCCQIGLAGPQAESLVKALCGNAGTERLGTTHADTCSALCISSQQQRYLVTLTAEQPATQWQQLCESATPVNSAVWDYLDICAGYGFVQQPTQEMFIPQMLNLQLTGGVSFTKGCYTGQEIIARTQYRGNLKRRMYRLTCTASTVPEAGSLVFNDRKEQPIGNVVAAQQTAPDCVALLAVMALSETRDEALLLDDKHGPPLQLQELPYTLDS